MKKEGRQGRESVDTVTAAPVARDEVYTPLPCLVSITPPLALGRKCSLTPVCRPRFSVAFHSPSLMLTPGLSAVACRHVSIFPFSLSLSLWMGFSSSEYERNKKWLWLYSVVHGIALCIIDSLNLPTTCLLNTQLIYLLLCLQVSVYQQSHNFPHLIIGFY